MSVPGGLVEIIGGNFLGHFPTIKPRFDCYNIQLIYIDWLLKAYSVFSIFQESNAKILIPYLVLCSVSPNMMVNSISEEQWLNLF